MKKMLVLACSLFVFNSWALSYRNALRIPSDAVVRVHDFAIQVNEPRASSRLSSGGRCVGDYIESGGTVICSFLKSVPSNESVDAVASDISSRFGDKEIILTGYALGAEYAEKLAGVLSRDTKFEVNQIKLITFCSERHSKDLGRISLTSKLHFSRAFSNPDYYNSPMLEVPMSVFSEVRSRLTMVNAISFASGICSLSIGAFSHSYPLLLAGGALSGASVVSFLMQGSPYLPSYGVKSAYKRAVANAWSAEFESEFRQIGQ